MNHSAGSARKRPPLRSESAIRPIGSNLPFLVFIIFIASFYLRLPARFPVIAPLRPDMLLAALVLALLVPYMSQRAELLKLPAAKALSALMIWIVVSLPFVDWPGSVLRENWFPFVKATLLFYFTIFLVDTPGRFRFFVWLFVSLQIFRVVEPLFLNITTGYMGATTHLQYGEFAGRLSGAPADVINPNGLGFVIATATVFSHFLMWQSDKKSLKMLYIVLLPAMLYALILSMSRGGFIALLVGGGLILRQSKNKAGLVIIALALAIIGWSMMTDVQRERYTSLVSSDTRQSSSVEGRFRGMMNEFGLGLNSPIFGHGVGTTPEAKVNVLGSRSQAAHNLYAELLIEIGIVGMIIFLTFLSRVHGIVRDNLELDRARSRGGGEQEFYVRLNKAFFVVFWVYAVYSLNYFGLSQDYWYIFCGICVAYGFVVRRSEEVHPEPGASRLPQRGKPG